MVNLSMDGVIVIFFIVLLVFVGFFIGYATAHRRAKQEEEELHDFYKTQEKWNLRTIDDQTEVIRRRDAYHSLIVDTYVGWNQIKAHEVRGIFTTISAMLTANNINAEQLLIAPTSYFSHIISSDHWEKRNWSIEDELRALFLYAEMFSRQFKVKIYHQKEQKADKESTCMLPLITTVFLQNAIKRAFEKGRYEEFHLGVERHHFILYITILYTGKAAETIEEMLQPGHSISFVRKTLVGIARQHFVLKKLDADEIFYLEILPNETRCYFSIPYKTIASADNR